MYAKTNVMAKEIRTIFVSDALPDRPVFHKEKGVNYTLKVNPDTKVKIMAINECKIGLAEDLRIAVEMIVDKHYAMIYPDQS